VGSWSGYLFGLVQDFSKGDDAVDGLALAYADEQRITNSTGHVTQLILQVKVGTMIASAMLRVPACAFVGPASGQWVRWHPLSRQHNLLLNTVCWCMYCRCTMHRAATLPQQT
jgi:hypothetical protein